MPSVDLIRKVGLTEQVWEDAHGVHKMGKINPGDIVRLIERYDSDWYRIDYERSQAPGLTPPGDGYNEHWVKDNPNGLFLPVDGQDPDEDPVIPDPSDAPTDEEIGRVIRYLLKG